MSLYLLVATCVFLRVFRWGW